MVKSRTIVMSVNRSTGDVFDAILNAPPKMMPDAVQKNDGSWSFSTPRGIASLKFMENKDRGILDHQYSDDQATFNVPMKVVQSGEDSEVIITVEKPEVLTDEQFDERMVEIGSVFANLKTLIEKH